MVKDVVFDENTALQESDSDLRRSGGKGKLTKGKSVYASSPRHTNLLINERVGHGIIQKKHLSGVLKVRVVEASNLTAGALRFESTVPDPYVKMTIMDGGGWTAVRRTHTMSSTRTPSWREEFSFGIYRNPNDLVVRFDVFDEDFVEIDDHLGHALVPVHLNKMKAFQWDSVEVELESDRENYPHSAKAASGSIEIMLCWTPLGSRIGDCCGLCGCLYSPRAMNIFGSLQVNLCGFLLMVAYHSRWLCRGSSLDQCEEVGVQGVGACAIIACIAALFSGFHQLLGSIGFLGKDWEVSPPGVISLLEDPDQLEAGRDEEKKGLKIKTDLIPKDNLGLLSNFKLSMRLKEFTFFGFDGLPPFLHLLVWLQKVVAIAMCGLGLGLTYLVQDDGHILAEGAYLAVVSLALLMGSIPVFLRSEHLRSTDSTWKRFKQVKWQSKKESNVVRKMAANFGKAFVHAKMASDEATDKLRGALVQTSHKVRTNYEATKAKAHKAKKILKQQASSLGIQATDDTSEVDFTIETFERDEHKRACFSCGQ